MPPAIIAGVVALGAAAAAAASIITMTTALVIITAASVAGALLTKMDVPSFSAYTPQQERKQVLRAAAGPHIVVYGETISSGLLAFAEEQPGEEGKRDENHEELYIALVLASHKLSGIGEIWLGDDLVQNFGTLVNYDFHNDRTTVDPYLMSKAPSWKSDMIGRGLAWLRLTLVFDSQKFPSGLPNIKVRKYGREVYDPRTSKYMHTNNAALVILDYYRVYCKVPDSDIDWESFKAGANICDEMITTPDGQRNFRYTINGEFDVSEPIAKILDAMHEACAGEATFMAGKHGILIGAYYGPATMTLDESCLSGDIKIVSETSWKDRINTITGTFVDAAQNYTEVDYPAVAVNEWIAEDGRVINKDQNYRFVTNEFQAQRLANINLRRSRLGRMLEVPLNMKGYKFRPGMYVNFTLKALGIVNHEFRVTSWSFDPKKGVTATLREEQAGIWDDAIGVALDRPPLTSLPTGGIAAPHTLAIRSEPIGEVVQAVLTWQNTGSFAGNAVLVRRDGELVYAIDVPSPTQVARLQGLPFGEYSVSIIARNSIGAKSTPSMISFTVELPPMPVGAQVEVTNNSITIIPQYSTVNSFGTTCEFWFSRAEVAIDEVEQKAILKGTAGQFTQDGLRHNTTYYFYVRTINAYGKSGFIMFSGTTTASITDLLELLENAITDTQLVESLRDKINAAADQTELNTTILEIREIIKTNEEATAHAIDSLTSNVNDIAASIDANIARITMVSVGANASPQVQSGIFNSKNDEVLSAGLRSINILTYDRETMDPGSPVSFDVYASEAQAEACATYLNGLTDDVIVLLYTYNDPSVNSQLGGLPLAITRLGGTTDAWKTVGDTPRCCYVLIGIPGSREGSARQYIETRTTPERSVINTAVTLSYGNFLGMDEQLLIPGVPTIQVIQSAVETERTARSEETGALGERIDTVSAKAGENTAAVQTVAQALSELDGEIRSSWFTKVQINGVGGGFGMSAILNEDGTVLTTFVVDADVFAILAKGTGDNKINPFVVSNGVVYINKLMVDNAEIGSILSKYIDVKYLTAATIVGSNITGGTITGSHISTPNGRFTVTADGNLTASNVNVSGYINATDGTFSGTIYGRDGYFAGTIYANRIEGDVVKGFSLVATLRNEAQQPLYISAFSKQRFIQIPMLYNPGVLDGPVRLYKDGVIIKSVSPHRYDSGFGYSYYFNATGVSVTLPANTATTLLLIWDITNMMEVSRPSATVLVGS